MVALAVEIKTLEEGSASVGGLTAWGFTMERATMVGCFVTVVVVAITVVGGWVRTGNFRWRFGGRRCFRFVMRRWNLCSSGESRCGRCCRRCCQCS